MQSELLAPFPTLARTAEQIISLNDFAAKLNSGRQLKVKFGVDVTAPLIHIGHAVNLWAMRELQDHGHQVTFLIGDFTTRIGDPTGKSKKRPTISRERIERDAEGFLDQVSAILRTDPDVFHVARNSQWWDAMSLDAFLSLVSYTTHAQLIKRDMFQHRISGGDDIAMHELLYPILQGVDSVELRSDLTIVGTDQLFNEMMGRTYQHHLGVEPQTVITTAITPGIDGGEKQSKSIGNYIALSDSPRDKYGKAMSIPDTLVPEYLRVYTLAPLDICQLPPMHAKRAFARALVERYHGPESAAAEDAWFTEVFSRRAIPEGIPEVVVRPDATVVDIVRACLPESSTSHVRRLIAQGAVRAHGRVPLTEPDQRDAIVTGTAIRIGRGRWYRMILVT